MIQQHSVSWTAGKGSEAASENHFSKESPGQMEERDDSDLSEEEFTVLPGDSKPLDEREKHTLEKEDGEPLFEAEAPTMQPEEMLVEDSVDLLGLDSEAPSELLPPPSEMKSSSSNADLLNDLFVVGAQEGTEDSTADLLGGEDDFFFSGQAQPPTNSQRASPPTVATSSTGM